MALNDRAAALTPYARQLLTDKDVQDALRSAAGATRDAYGRARGKSAREAAADKKLRRAIQQAIAAAGELRSAIDEPAARRRPRWRRRLMLVAVGASGLYLAANAEAREKALGVLGKKAPTTTSPSQ